MTSRAKRRLILVVCATVIGTAAIVVLINGSKDDVQFSLPDNNDATGWKLLFSSASQVLTHAQAMAMPALSIAVLCPEHL